MKKLLVGILMVVLLFGTVACGAAEEQTASSENGWKPTTTPAPEPVIPSYPSKGGSGDYESEMPPVQEPDDAGHEYVDGEPVSVERMIIRSGSMSLVVDDVALSIQEIVDLADTYGGWVVDSSSWQERDRTMGNITIRVLAEHFEDTLRDLRDMAYEVRQENTSGRDVTEEYVDLSARLNNLEASEAQLLELMAQAGNVSEILEVQRELTNTRSEIEQIKGRMKYLEESSSTSIIQVYLEQSKLTVEFYASTRSIKEGEKIRFYAEISGGFSPYTYEWDFGDGNTSTEEAPVHSYNDDGKYTVSLKITDDRGGTVESARTDYLTILTGWDAGNTASSAWNGLVSFGKVLVDILTWIGIFAPVWIIIGLIIYFVRKRRRNARIKPSDKP